MLFPANLFASTEKIISNNKDTKLNKNKKTKPKAKPVNTTVRTKPTNTTVIITAHVCISLCTTVLHNTANLPRFLYFINSCRTSSYEYKNSDHYHKVIFTGWHKKLPIGLSESRSATMVLSIILPDGN